VLRADLIPPRRGLLSSVARVVLGPSAAACRSARPRRRPVNAPIRRRKAAAALVPEASPPPPPRRTSSSSTAWADLRADGREYVTILGPGQSTPAPWINVIANPGFGFQVAAEGGGYTWSVNSRENQLTPWSNDPVSDRPGRGFLPARRGNRRSLGPDGAADPRRSAGDLCRPARPGLQPVRAHAHGIAPICCSTCRSAIRSRSRA
jgi:cyclic beta-1,2-glucan synthetase